MAYREGKVVASSCRNGRDREEKKKEGLGQKEEFASFFRT